jgi:hypothetical protein
MITLKDYMEAIQYKVSEGSEYLWNCYGPNVRSMDCSNHDGSIIVSCVFDTEDQTVYEMQAWDEANGIEYRWIHPDYIEDVKAEAESRNVDFEQSFDDRKFTDLEVAEDILEKATAMVAGEEYDKRIMVTLTLGYDEEHLLMEMAHEADMSLNKFVEYILREEMAKHGIEV